MDRSRVGIVIPALNEAATIAEVVHAAGKYGLVIVVDDGSGDETPKLAEEAGAFVVSHTHNRGYDSALNTGFKKAAELDVEMIITLDADGQHDPSLIQRFIDKIDEGADVVIGERSERQRVSENLFAWWTGLRFGIMDPLCGMKAYRRTTYKLLGHFDSYESIGTELMMFAAKNMLIINQIPFEVRARRGESRFGQMLSGNYKILRAMLLSFWRIKKMTTLSSEV